MTWREIIYMILDELKGMSDDFTFTEDHIAFLLGKYRSFILKQRYYTDIKKVISESNYQTICLDLIEVPSINGESCEGSSYLRSKEKIPVTLMIGNPRVYPIDYYQGNGKIACVLMGDSHIDRVHIGKTGVPYIISQCDRTEPYHGDINVPRVSGTISENHFEVVLIDKKKQEVRLYSIGSDARDGVEDEVGEMVNLRVLNY